MYANIDLHMIGYARNAEGPAGHYAKRDCTGLPINRKNSPPLRALTIPLAGKMWLRRAAQLPTQQNKNKKVPWGRFCATGMSVRR